jgi:hypothetical protein
MDGWVDGLEDFQCVCVWVCGKGRVWPIHPPVSGMVKVRSPRKARASRRKIAMYIRIAKGKERRFSRTGTGLGTAAIPSTHKYIQ